MKNSKAHRIRLIALFSFGFSLSLGFNFGFTSGFQITNAQASGCGPFGGIELGKKIDSKEVVGIFQCKPDTITQYPHCRFHSDALKADLRFRDLQDFDFDTSDSFDDDNALAPEQAPPTGVKIRTSIDTYEGMHWADCDGNYPPSFSKNGVYTQLVYHGVKYWGFKEDPSSLKSDKAEIL